MTRVAPSSQNHARGPEPVPQTAEQRFHHDAAEKTADLTHRAIIRKNIDTYDVAVARGKSRFADWEAARQRCHEIKWEGVNHLDRYLEEFEANVRKRGGHVFWAANSEEARNYVVQLAQARAVKTIVKSKSMITEEIFLNPALEKCGIHVWETDLGEYIVQLRNEPPYHIVTPAMHLNREQIAKLFREKIPNDVTDDSHSELVAAARRALRRAFFSAEMGISGANFLVADTGMVAISTNEGNARLCTSVPKIHVVFAGIEKVIPRLQDLAALWPVLATAGTGQHITTYSTLIGGPRTANENDGPEEFHVILLDNGRSELLADLEQRDVLFCIRCGACLNACPVYRNVGGHSYGTTYQGPIGSVLTPHLRGLNEFQHLSYASSLCGNCTDVCPVKIDLAHHLLHNRRNAVEEGDRPWLERLGMRLWRWAMMSGPRFRLAGSLGRWVLLGLYGAGAQGTSADPLKPWTRNREAPPLAPISFHDMWRRQNGRR
jgi:L-lactate dehydrogenase complex protein LldF